MATKLFLRTTMNNNLGTSSPLYCLDMLTTAGSSGLTNQYINVSSGQTERQWLYLTSNCEWVSPRVATAFTLTSTDISLWFKEDSTNVNATARYKIYKLSGGTETELGGGSYDLGTEVGTSFTEYTWTGNVSDTSFAVDDRIVLKVFIIPVGTFNSGAVYLQWQGADGSDGDSFLNLAETVAFKNEDSTTTKTITGKMKVGQETLKTITGKLWVQDTTIQDITGKLNVGNLSTQTITGKLSVAEPSSRVVFKIVNNLIVDADRETWITEIADTLFGLAYYPFEADTIGIGHYEIGDRIIVKDTADVSFESVVFEYEVKITQGIRETLKAEVPSLNSTNFNHAGILGKRITNTEIKVDKQNAEIQLINSSLENDYSTTAEIALTTNSINSTVSAISTGLSTLQSDVSTLTQTADALSLAITSTGGSNLLKNAVGLKGDIKEWQLLDADGALIDARNTGTIDTSTNTSFNTESQSAIILANQYIEQTPITVEGMLHTVYFKYSSNADADLILSGTTVTIPASTDFAVFKYAFTALGNSTRMRIENGSGDTITVSDIVLKQGDANGWIQAPNEIYGIGYAFDKDGFRINKSDSYFKSLLDNIKFAVYETSTGVDKVVMYVSKDGGAITNLTVSDVLQLQRYGNTAKAMRFIPTSDGGMLVINN